MKPRIIRKNELEKLLQLYRKLHPDDKNIIEDALQQSWDLILSNNSFFRYYVIEENEAFIASCCIAVIPNLTRDGRPYGVIENVITDPPYRRKGLASLVMNAAIDFAKEKNCYKIMLLSNADRTEAHEFYSRLGFDMDSKKGFVLKL